MNESAIHAYREACEGKGSIALPEFRLIRLTGEDVMEWLQGQVTNDLRGMSVGDRISFCFCQPTGQLLARCDAWLQEEGLYLATEADCVAAVLSRVEEMVIMEDVAAEELPLFLTHFVSGQESGGFAFCNDRVGLVGLDVWTPEQAEGSISRELYEALRLEAGMPAFGRDANVKTLPPELGPVFEARHISYQKGCYTGQEVLMRIHSRGHTNRTWVGLLSQEPLSSGDKVSHESREDAGEVTSSAWSPEYGWIAAAHLRNEAANPGASVSARTQNGTVEAEVVPMPIRKR